jgi:hypothetical protein
VDGDSAFIECLQTNRSELSTARRDAGEQRPTSETRESILRNVDGGCACSLGLVRGHDDMKIENQHLEFADPQQPLIGTYLHDRSRTIILAH